MNLSWIKYRLANTNLPSSTSKDFTPEVEEGIKSLALILDADDKNSLIQFEVLKKEMNVRDVDFSVIICSEERREVSRYLYFSKEDVRLTGKIMNAGVIDILNRQHDVLVVFVKELTPAVEFLVRNARAGITIGRTENSSGFFHLSIACLLDEVEIFTNEVKKYLRIIKMKA